MRNYQKFSVWEKSLTLDVYKLTHSFPKDEIFGLISQMKRASSSIPNNIERDLNFINSENGQKLLFQVEEVKKMLNGLIKKLNNAEV